MIRIDVVKDIIWDRFPVIKITEYPFEQKEYKPFAQAQICYKLKEGLVVRMWAFEVEPMSKIKVNNDARIFSDSVLSVVIMERDINSSIILTINSCGKYFLQYNKGRKKEIVDEEVNINNFRGEDLQGIYWGGEILIGNKILNKYLNFYKEKGIKELYINFIKSCNEINHLHCGGMVFVDKKWTQNLAQAIIK